jgi:hypothetical protein
MARIHVPLYVNIGAHVVCIHTYVVYMYYHLHTNMHYCNNFIEQRQLFLYKTGHNDT